MVSRSYYVDRGRGDLSESDFIDILQGLKSKRERIKQMIVENERAMAEIERKIATGDNRRELAEQYANVDHLTREMVEHQLVKKWSHKKGGAGDSLRNHRQIMKKILSNC